MCGATDGPQRTDFSAADVRGDQFFCRGRSWGLILGDQFLCDRPLLARLGLALPLLTGVALAYAAVEPCEVDTDSHSSVRFLNEHHSSAPLGGNLHFGYHPSRSIRLSSSRTSLIRGIATRLGTDIENGFELGHSFISYSPFSSPSP